MKASPLDLLRRHLQNDPALQARLFEIRDAGEFVAAMARLAEECGHAVAADELMSRLRQGQRDWIERESP